MDPSALKSEPLEARRPSDADSQEPPTDSSSKPPVKKRTKTGCLTCRRRRIKCDEGKPTCNNCIKSKRPCDGYNQRVIFKDPMGAYPTGHMGPIAFRSSPANPMVVHPQMPPGPRGAVPPSQGTLPFIAPKLPMMNDYQPSAQHHIQPRYHPQQQQQQQPYHNPQQHQPPLLAHALPLHHGQPVDPNFAPFLHPNLPHGPLDHSSASSAPAPAWQQQQLPDATDPASYNRANVLSSAHYDAAQAAAEQGLLSTSGHPAPWPTDRALGGISTAPPPPPPPPPPPSAQHYVQPHSSTNPPAQAQDQAQAQAQAQGRAGEHSNPDAPERYSVFNEQDAYWYSDDDASMAESLEEEEEDEDEANHLESNDLGAIVAKRLHNRPLDTFGTRMRTFSTFADANVLATYIPSSINSPLNDAQTASVFWYFVNVTGPSMSLFERRPFDPTPIFQGQPVPRSRQHIWTYTFPIIALNHPALLQAMLALGSLQMAKLQGLPHTASMKHYHLSLRRVARNYQSVSRRVQPATLAATMLLGFYEVWNSDHDKWCKHMWGARAILKEIPLKDMSRKIMALKQEQRQNLQNANASSDGLQYSSAIVGESGIDQVDSALVARLAAQPVAYEDDTPQFSGPDYAAGPVPAWTAPDRYTEKDIETYELIADLFWWYCKMDVYQSILGGTPLFYWTQCAPRAPINKLDAIYGTYDHLMVLLGRLCNFASKDQARKRKAKKPEGAPGGGQGQSPPGFAGMMPSTGHVTIPKGFSPPRETSPQSEPESHEETNFKASTAVAMREWESICQTFEVFRAQLGPDFEPLGPEYELPVASPFGLSLKYRTYSIAGIWLNYYMGLIVLHRSHPSMPPVAMAAAGLAARQTAPYANEIGRIVAGLTTDDLSTMTHVSTLLGSVSIESSFPMFVAAVQYQDTAQRHWTVKRMRNVARLTGWQSARQIADGCEVGWKKAAGIGRGPPYEPPADLEDVPLPLWEQPRRITDRIRELKGDDERLVLSSSERPHYAVGLLSMEADLEKLELSDRA